MSELTRLDITCGDGGRYRDQSPTGEFVDAEDALALEQRNIALTKVLSTALQALSGAQYLFNRYIPEQNWILYIQRDIKAIRAVIGGEEPEPYQHPEPVGEVADMKYNRVQFYRATGDTSKPYLLPGTKLYAEPPAPVAVDSPEKPAVKWAVALNEIAKIIGMKCGDELTDVPTKLREFLAASAVDQAATDFVGMQPDVIYWNTRASPAKAGAAGGTLFVNGVPVGSSCIVPPGCSVQARHSVGYTNFSARIYWAPKPKGRCRIGENCLCGGDTEGVRAQCDNWIKP